MTMTDAKPLDEPRGLGWLATYWADKAPDRPAFTIGERTMTRRELDTKANRMARALADMGVKAGDIVALHLPNGPEYFVFGYALWKLGATPMPLSTKLPQREFDDIVALANPSLIVSGVFKKIGDYRIIDINYEPSADISDAPMPEIISKHWKAVTSGGSTGRPKVIVDGGPSAVLAYEPHAFSGVQPEDIMLHPAPMYHNATFAQTNWGISWGAHVISMAKFDAEGWLKLVEKYRVQWAYLVPTMMSRIWQLPEDVRNKYDVSSLRVVNHMAAPCPAWLKQAWIDWLGPERVWEVYGSSEAVGGAVVTGTEWLTHPGTVGKPGVETRILDEDGKECPTGEVGEIYFKQIEGAPAPYHYIGAEPRILNGWESIGDMGYIDEDGYLYLADRRTDMIVSGGANIYPAELEAALERHPDIVCSAVVGLPHPDFGRVPHAIIELEPGRPGPDAAELNAFLSEHLVRYKLPYTYEYTAEQVRDDAGKVRRPALRDDCIARLEKGERFTSLRGGS